MKTEVAILLLAFSLCGCGQKTDPKIAVLEARITALENKSADLQNQLLAIPAPQKYPERVSPAPSQPVTRVMSDAIEIPAAKAQPNVISISGRVTEQNDVWWKWAYVMVVANTNNVPVSFDANIQFLDKDGFVVSEKEEYNLTLRANLTNRISSFDMIDVAPASTIKNIKAVIVPK